MRRFNYVAGADSGTVEAKNISKALDRLSDKPVTRLTEMREDATLGKVYVQCRKCKNLVNENIRCPYCAARTVGVFTGCIAGGIIGLVLMFAYVVSTVCGISGMFTLLSQMCNGEGIGDIFNDRFTSGFSQTIGVASSAIGGLIGWFIGSSRKDIIRSDLDTWEDRTNSLKCKVLLHLDGDVESEVKVREDKSKSWVARHLGLIITVGVLILFVACLIIQAELAAD